MKSFFFPILLFFSFHAFGQNNTSPHTQLVTGLVNYRNELIAENSDNFKEISKLDTLWKLGAEHQDEVQAFLGNVIYAHEVALIPPKKMIKKWEKQDLPFFYLLSEDNIRIILENKHLIGLLAAGILEADPPFKIASGTWLFKELDFYKIKDRMHVAEIGAGNGVFSLMLGLAYDSLSIYVNDLNYSNVEFAMSKITQCQSKKDGNKYIFVNGKKKATQLENVKLDKIIIRNSFHHFSHRAEMLESIKQSLLPDGNLYIADPFLAPDHSFGCNKVMPLEDIKKALLENGFRIVEEKHNPDWDWVYLHCKPIT